MVRTKKIFRNHILEGAYVLVLEQGFQHFHARNIAKQLSCSTQPIYREFSNLLELKEALTDRVNDKFQLFLQAETPESLNSLGARIVQYARENPSEFLRFFLEEYSASDRLKETARLYYTRIDQTSFTEKQLDPRYELFWEYAIGKAALSLNRPEPLPFTSPFLEDEKELILE